MKLRGGFDLTYCSNIHAGESWPDVRDAIASALPKVRRHLGAAGPLAIGLRLSARAGDELAQPAELDAFRAFLREGDYYVPTINGFPFGAFHRERVKENVYLPDWRDRSRVDYTNRLAGLLATLLSDRGLDDRLGQHCARRVQRTPACAGGRRGNRRQHPRACGAPGSAARLDGRDDRARDRA